MMNDAFLRRGLPVVLESFIAFSYAESWVLGGGMVERY
jgi:hypothetical protein